MDCNKYVLAAKRPIIIINLKPRYYQRAGPKIHYYYCNQRDIS